MTFDDGPIRGTENVLRIVQEEGIEATMFYIGREVVRSPALFHQALAMPSVLVANHTYTHANGHYRRFYHSPASHVIADIDKAQHVIGGAKYLRLCGRNVWRLPTVHRDDWGINVAQRGHEIPKYDALQHEGYFIYGWDVEWPFSHKTQKPIFSGEELARRVNAALRSGRTVRRNSVVVLAHDFMFRSEYNAEQLRTFIRIVKAQGWTFRTIDAFSDATPDTLRPEVPIKTTRPDALRPAQKLARQATVLVPENHPQVVMATPATDTTDLTTRLTRAIAQQSFLEIRRLLAQGAKLNTTDLKGRLPLNVAIETNNAVLVRMLVERGAHIFNLDANGMSPMGVARQQNNTIIVRYLTRQIRRQKALRLQRPVFASNE
jgi:peptidoglycan/xylan/chitin deacetylase (PgdA/CDA1 family)